MLTNDDWNGTGRPVKNHLCEGLKKFQARSDDSINKSGNWDFNCIPIFDEDGNTRGCDDTNYNKIEYCPFCGIKL